MIAPLYIVTSRWALPCKGSSIRHWLGWGEGPHLYKDPRKGWRLYPCEAEYAAAISASTFRLLVERMPT